MAKENYIIREMSRDEVDLAIDWLQLKDGTLVLQMPIALYCRSKDFDRFS